MTSRLLAHLRNLITFLLLGASRKLLLCTQPLSLLLVIAGDGVLDVLFGLFRPLYPMHARFFALQLLIVVEKMLRF